MAVNYKNPPEMREDLLYADWKTELEIWRSFTDLAKAKQDPAMFLSLKGKARQTALAEVKPADLAKDLQDYRHTDGHLLTTRKLTGHNSRKTQS